MSRKTDHEQVLKGNQAARQERYLLLGAGRTPEAYERRRETRRRYEERHREARVLSARLGVGIKVVREMLAITPNP